MTITLIPASSVAPAIARQALIDGVGDQLSSERLADATLLISEVVTNAVRHAGLHPNDRITVAVQRNGLDVLVEVTDPGSGFRPGSRSADGIPTGGWGFLLLDQLSDGWGLSDGPGGGTVVWFRMALGG